MHEAWVVVILLCILLGVLVMYQNNTDEVPKDVDFNDMPMCENCGSWYPGMRPRCPRELAMQQAFILHMKQSGGVVPREALKDTSERWRNRNRVSIYNPGKTYDYPIADDDGVVYDAMDNDSHLLRSYKKSLSANGNFRMGWRR
jgi:hypothetical protein